MKKLRLISRTLSIFALSGLLLDQPSAAFQMKPTMPDAYVPANISYCPIDVLPKGRSFSERRSSTLNLIELLYGRSHFWNDHYMVVTADYENYSSIGLIILGRCSSSDLVAPVLNLINSTRLSAALMVNSKKPFVSSAAVIQSIPSPIARFHKFNPGADVRRCIFSLTFDPINKRLPFPNAYDAAAKVWIKYRIPFADITQINGTTFFLLANTCEKKYRIYKELLFALGHDGIHVLDGGRFNADPDISEYIRAQPSR